MTRTVAADNGARVATQTGHQLSIVEHEEREPGGRRRRGSGRAPSGSEGPRGASVPLEEMADATRPAAAARSLIFSRWGGTR